MDPSIPTPHRCWRGFSWNATETTTDSSSDSASHTHSARRPSAAALLTRSRGGGLTTPSQKENSRNCVWVAGGLSECECVC